MIVFENDEAEKKFNLIYLIWLVTSAFVDIDTKSEL